MARELKAAGWRLKEVTTDNGSDELPRKLGAITHNVARTRWEGSPVAKRCHLIPTPGAALVPSWTSRWHPAGRKRCLVDETTERLGRLEPGSLFAGYRIEGILDRGGMGLVYKATDAELDRTVALKIIAPEHTQNPDAVTRFKSEARLAASLEHPNIVPIHRGGEYQGVLYLAMRYVPGTNLRQVIDRGQLSLDRIQRVVRSVASALDAAHERGLVHRDVKPANILITGEGPNEQVYLTDFGLTKKLGSPGSLTRTGAWVGTADYVAPEQIQGGAVDGRTDVYSLGCVVYEMLTGSVAYPKDNDMAKLWAHVQDPPPSPRLKRPELVAAFDDVVSRATAKDPSDRFVKASDLAGAVDRAVAEQSVALGPDAVDATSAAGVAPSTDEHDVFVAGPTRGSGSDGRDTVPPPTPPPGGGDKSEGAPAASGGRGTRTRLVAAVAGLVVVLGVLAAVLLTGGDGGSEEEASPSAVAGRVATKLPSDLAWRPIASPPFQRQYAATTAVDGKVIHDRRDRGQGRRAPPRKMMTPRRTAGPRGRGCRLHCTTPRP